MKIRHCLAAFVALSIASPAAAFDLPPPVDAPEYTGTIASASGWYIRGDLGYVHGYDAKNPTFREYNAGTDDYTDVTFNSARIDGDYSLSAGAGYQFNDFLRTDLTVDYFKASFDGKASKNSRCSHWQPASSTCSYVNSSSLSSLGILANGYVDLGTFWGLTPYVGAGAGVASVDWNTMKITKRCEGTGCNAFVDYSPKKYEGTESWRMSYALMAGISYDLAPRTKLDFGYRYATIADGDMFGWNSAETKAGAKGVKGQDDGLSRHEFRAGLRLTTW